MRCHVCAVWLLPRRLLGYQQRFGGDGSGQRERKCGCDDRAEKKDECTHDGGGQTGAQSLETAFSGLFLMARTRE